MPWIKQAYTYADDLHNSGAGAGFLVTDCDCCTMCLDPDDTEDELDSTNQIFHFISDVSKYSVLANLHMNE